MEDASVVYFVVATLTAVECGSGISARHRINEGDNFHSFSCHHTVEFDCPVRLAQRVFGDALVRSKVVSSDRTDFEPHVDAVGVVGRDTFVLVSCRFNV